MRKIQTSTFFLLMLLVLRDAWAASSESSIRASSSEIDQSSQSLQIKPSVSLLVGSSSNVGKLQSETAGSYGKVSPALGFEFAPSDAVVFTTQLNADIKQYSSPETRLLADETNAEIRNLGIWFLTENWEFGGDLGATYAENRIPVQLTDTQTAAQEQKYTEPDGRVYLAWTKEELSFEGGFSAKVRNYSTLMNDRGNTFHNDFDVFGGDLKAGYSISDNLKVSLRGSIENRTYKEKPADFTDGAPSNSANPLPILQETSNELSLITEYGWGKVKLSSAPTLRLNKDRIFGARDSKTWKFQQKATIPFSGKLTWSPGVTISQESFDRFRSDPLNDPYGSPLRKDMDLRVSSPFKYSFNSSLQLLAEYVFSRKDSNYANSSYVEHAVSTGLSVSM